MPHTLPTLSYEYNALEPYIDAKTMEIHHTKHHQAYIDKLNTALEKYPELAEKPVEDLLKDLSAIPEDIRTAVRNHGGGHYNHSVFWTMMSSSSAKASEGKPSGELAGAIDTAFGSFDDFKKQFADAAGASFGSGWVWVTKDSDNKLEIMSTANQDSPISEGKHVILGLDVWEHAYYITYFWNRAEYIKNWWSVINWEEVAKRHNG